MSALPDLPFMAVGEITTQTVDLAAQISTGLTISSAVLTKLTLAGPDYSSDMATPPVFTYDAPALTLGSATVTGSKVSFQVSNQVGDSKYRIIITATMNDGTVIVAWTHLYVDNPD